MLGLAVAAAQTSSTPHGRRRTSLLGARARHGGHPHLVCESPQGRRHDPGPGTHSHLSRYLAGASEKSSRRTWPNVHGRGPAEIFQGVPGRGGSRTQQLQQARVSKAARLRTGRLAASVEPDLRPKPFRGWRGESARPPWKRGAVSLRRGLASGAEPSVDGVGELLPVKALPHASTSSRSSVNGARAVA